MDFRGIDWTELSEYFGVSAYNNETENDEDILHKTKEYFYSVLFSSKEQEVAAVLRIFLKKLYENSNGKKYTAPIWKGLLDVDDDYTLIKYSIVLLEYMWY